MVAGSATLYSVAPSGNPISRWLLTECLPDSLPIQPPCAFNLTDIVDNYWHHRHRLVVCGSSINTGRTVLKIDSPLRHNFLYRFAVWLEQSASASSQTEPANKLELISAIYRLLARESLACCTVILANSLTVRSDLAGVGVRYNLCVLGRQQVKNIALLPRSNSKALMPRFRLKYPEDAAIHWKDKFGYGGDPTPVSMENMRASAIEVVARCN